MRIRVRTILVLVALAAVCLAEVKQVEGRRNRVEVVGPVVHYPGGGTSSTLLLGETRTHFVGPIPLGQYPICALTGVLVLGTSLARFLLGRFRAHRRADRPPDLVTGGSASRPPTRNSS